MPGERCARWPRVQVKKAHELVTTVTPASPGIPRAIGFNGLCHALPGEPGFLSPSSAEIILPT
jgi:hypothetical protein